MASFDIESSVPSVSREETPTESTSDGHTNGLHHDSWDWCQDPKNMEASVVGRRVIFHPIYAFGTAGVRGQKKLTSSTVAYWEVEICQPLYGTSVMFGVGNVNAKTIARSQFIDLLGDDTNSYGLTHMGKAFHAGLGIPSCRPLKATNCTVGVLFNGPERSISFFENGKLLCCPFKDIDVSQPLYPMIASTAQQSSFIVRQQMTLGIAPSLVDCALNKVHNQLTGTAIFQLPLPTTLIDRLVTMDRKRRNNEAPRQVRPPKRPIVPDFLDDLSARTAYHLISYLEDRNRRVRLNRVNHVFPNPMEM